MNEIRKCPVCGKSEAEVGSYEICEFCGWEEDIVCERDPEFDVGANGISLNEAIAYYKEHGKLFK